MNRLPILLLALAILPRPARGQGVDLPEGWRIRADRAGAALDQVAFTVMPPGWHVTTGPAVILWNPEMAASGGYGVEMETFLFDPRDERAGFGTFFGGRRLDGEGRVYSCFLIRDGGQFKVMTREGRSTSTIVDWTDHPSIRGYEERERGEVSVKNVLAVQVRGRHVRFFVNGQEVTRVHRDQLHLDGFVGMRVGQALDLHVSRLEITPGN